MSVEHTIYCGPYVECKVETTTSMSLERRCPKAARLHSTRSNTKNDKVCPACLSTMVDVNIEVEEDAVDAWELQDEFEGDMLLLFFNEGNDIWVKDGGSFFVDQDDDSLRELQ